MTKKLVHWIGYASQPDLQFMCDESWSTPDWEQPKLPKDVHLAADGRLYAFDYGPVTCSKCLRAEFERMREEAMVKAEKKQKEEHTRGYQDAMAFKPYIPTSFSYLKGFEEGVLMRKLSGVPDPNRDRDQEYEDQIHSENFK